MHSKWFSNGSKIDSEATTTQSGRGLAISLLFGDEFGHVDPNVAELFWTAISPTLATGGKALIASTPNGDHNLYAQLWRGALAGINGFTPVEIQWDEPPGRDEAFKQEQIGKIGITKWSQEYECLQSETMINIIDDLGNVRDISIKDLYMELAENEYT
jgi:phage FluMu gp28-like protein